MRHIVLLICFSVMGTFLQCDAIAASRPLAENNSFVAAKQSISPEAFVNLQTRDIEKAFGRKLKFGERISVKLLQWKMKKELKKEKDEEDYRQKGTLSFLCGLAGFVLLFVPYGVIASIILGILGIIFGIKGLKARKNTLAVIGLILSGATIILILLAVAYAATWGWLENL